MLVGGFLQERHQASRESGYGKHGHADWMTKDRVVYPVLTRTGFPFSILKPCMMIVSQPG